MGNPYPVHTCTVGPFDSYHSNVVNRLTRLVSNYEDCIFSPDKIDVTQDSPSQLSVSAGSAIKDDVFVNIESIDIDFTDPDFYFNHSTWDEVGYYYIMLYYVYEKARPAPQPSIQILKPSERVLFVPGPNCPWIFLKAAKVELVGSNLEITSLLDSDPDNITVRRIYSKTYIGLEDDQPIFSFSRDYGRLVITDDSLYYGGLTDWISVSSDIENLRIFVGADGPGDTTPDYASIRHIVQNTSLETAISTLDLSLGYSSLNKTISNNSPTPSILSAGGKICGYINIENTSPTTITDLFGAPSPGTNDAIIVALYFGNSNTVVQHGGNIVLTGSVDFAGTTGSILILSRRNGKWREVSRNTTYIGYILGPGELELYWLGTYGGSGGKKHPTPIPLPPGTWEGTLLGSLYINPYITELSLRIRGIHGASNTLSTFSGNLRFGVGPFAAHRRYPYGSYDSGISRMFTPPCTPVTSPIVPFTATTTGDTSFVASFTLDVTSISGSHDLALFMYPDTTNDVPYWMRVWSWEIAYK